MNLKHVLLIVVVAVVVVWASNNVSFVENLIG